LMTFSYVLTGSISESNESGAIQKFFRIIGSSLKTVFSPRISIILKVFVTDVLLQRRLYDQSVSRWLIHSLIFMPFVFRFVWGIVALLASLWKPESEWIWFMLDKNHAVTAFLFDLSGILILAGIVLAFIRGTRLSDRPPGLPRQDRIALVLIGAMVLIGFILEGMRIAMTGSPQDASYAFIGYGISSLFNGFAGLNRFYGYVWYMHAITAGAFIAYLPFSRLSHIIMAPFVLAMRALAESEHEKRHT
jgi:nitrate reductase gamma subunit